MSVTYTAMHLQGAATLDLGNQYRSFEMYVNGTGNKLQNGSFVGKLYMAENSVLTSDSGMCSWNGPELIEMKNGSTLNMVTGHDVWINNLNALRVNGQATINNAFLRVRSVLSPGREYTLGNGVQNLNGSGTFFVLTGDDRWDHFNLDGYTANFDIIVWESVDPADILIRNGKINKYVQIRDTYDARKYCTLNLEDVEIQRYAVFSVGVGASLVMKNGTTAAGGATFNLGERASLTMQNGTTVAGGATFNLGDRASLTMQSGATVAAGVAFNLGERASLTMQSGATVAAGVAFNMRNGSTLDLGGHAISLSQITLASGATATVSNGEIGIPGGGDSEMPYTLKFGNSGNKPSYIEGNNVRLDLEGDVKFATNQKTRFLVHGDYLDNPTRPVSLDVVADGQFLLGDAKDGQGGSITRRLYGKVNISHKGQTRIDSTTFDVDVTGYRLMGDLTATMNGCAIAIGPVGFENDGTTPGGTVSVEDADEIKVTSFIGQSMTLYASESVQLTGNGRAFGNNTGTTAVANLGTGAKLVIGGARGKNPNINFQANLSAHSIELTGQNISGTGVYGDARDGATFVEFADSCTINATGTIGINEGFKGGALKVEGGGNVVLDLLGKEGATLSSAVVTSHTGDVVMRSFTGGTLKAKANGALIVGRDSASGYPLSVTGLPAGGNVAASGIPAWDGPQQHAVELEGASVNIKGSLSASSNADYIKSTTGDITIGGNLSAGVSSTLESAKNITIGGNVTGGALEAAAVQSISMQNIGIGAKDALLTATNGSITAGNFTGGTLKANAKAALTFNGAVEASGAGKWQPAAGGTAPYAVVLEGGSVSIGGNLAVGSGKDYIRSTAGDIGITGTLNANDSSTLISAANITVGGNVTGGELTATAAQSISMQNIGIGTRDAVLTALDGSITAGSFNGVVLRAEATGDVTINGSAAASTGATLMGSGVSVKGSLSSSAGRHYVKSSAGDIGITGTLNAEISNFLESAKNITIGGDATVGALTATAAQSIQMQNISIGANDAELTATGGSITAGAFTGGALKANANAALTLNGNVVASGAGKWQLTTAADAPKYAVALEGGSVSIGGNLAANEGKNYVKGTAGDIAITGTLSAKVSSTLDSAANITVDGDVTGGALTATAGQAIQLKDISIGAKNAELTATGSSITAGNFIGSGALTATAGQSITLQHIGATGQAAGTVRLTAGGGITAANVNAGMLTATAAGSISMADVTVGSAEASILSTGEGGDVTLNSFSGAGAQIKASQGSVTVAMGATGSTRENRNTFTAAGSVSFNGATGVNNLAHAVINAPQVDWSNGTTLSDVTVSHWAPQPAKSPRLLLAAAGTGSAATVNVNGFLTLTENSTVNGNVVINKQDNVEPIVTVDHSTITGQVSGATKLVLDSGSVGSAVVNKDGTLAVVSSGTSAITALTDGQPIDYLTMNGGSLTVTNQGGSTGQVLVTELTVTENSALNSDMELQASGEATLTFDHLTAANETTAVLTMDGELTSNAEGSSHGGNVSYITICLSGNDDVEGGKEYALISLKDGQTPDFWDNVDLTPHVQFNAKATDENFFWRDNTLYYRNGRELEAAIWAPTQESHQWNTADKNWLQDDVRYRYKDGVTTVFDDTAFNMLENYGGDVHLEGVYTPSSVQVNNSAGNDYTFMGSGAIDGTTTTLTKDGEGTLTITNANTYSGGTIIMQGTLEVAHAGALGSGGVTLAAVTQEGIAQEGGMQAGGTQAGGMQDGGTLLLNYSGATADFGTVTLQGGTVQIANGSKSFDLVVTGTDARMEGDCFNAFIGNLTLEAGSHLVSAGSLAGWDGPTSILMKNGSMLEMDPNCDIWINDIANLAVEGEATMFNAFLRINPNTNGGVYTLDNGVQNLKGEGVTAYCLDGSTFDLNNHTTNLNIIVWNGQDVKNNVVEYGTVDTKVDIHDASRLYLGFDVVIGDRATFFMGDTAYLNLGGRSSRKARLNVFSFTGASATIDNGTLLVEKTKDGSPLVLGTNLRGEKTYVALRQESTLDLNRHSLAVETLKLDADAASATIGNGTVASGVVVDAGKALHLGAALNVTGAVSGSGTLVKNDDGGTAGFTGSMKDFTGNVEVQGGTLNLMNMAEAAQLNVADVAIMNGTLGVYQGETAPVTPDTANEGTLTISDRHTLTAGSGAQLNANLVMQSGSTLDVSATEGMGLLMGSSVTLNQGMQLSANDMDAVRTLGFMDKYDLFREADSFTIGSTGYEQIALMDRWVKASEVFANDDFSDGGKEYYVFYSGATQAGGAGGNVGTIYIMQVPEPTTSTLSLLALAALAARRRKR
ncbi:MAG: autotransporter-associated beta strand repeat-containing protein [Akkermansia sp.]|nr:autotransporter-associated beta strand repeat-containing protein [Akkermansia sp.]